MSASSSCNFENHENNNNRTGRARINTGTLERSNINGLQNHIDKNSGTLAGDGTFHGTGLGIHFDESLAD